MGSAPRTPSDGRVRPSGVSRGRCALVVAIGLLTILVGCSSGSSSTSSDSTTTTLEPSTPTPVYVDPATPISTPVGKEFEIMLPADPGSGWRWVLAPIDNTRLIALGSRFSDDAALLSKAASATTTTTTTAAAARPSLTTSSTSTTLPAVFPLVQIISFAGRAIGPATISLSYNQIAAAPQAENKVLTFTVQVVGEPPTTTATTMATSTTALIPSTTSSTTTTTTKPSTTTR